MWDILLFKNHTSNIFKIISLENLRNILEQVFLDLRIHLTRVIIKGFNIYPDLG